MLEYVFTYRLLILIRILEIILNSKKFLILGKFGFVVLLFFHYCSRRSVIVEMGNQKQKPNFLPRVGICIGLLSGRPYQGWLLCHRFYYLQGECYSFFLLMQNQIILLRSKFFSSYLLYFWWLFVPILWEPQVYAF